MDERPIFRKVTDFRQSRGIFCRFFRNRLSRRVDNSVSRSCEQEAGTEPIAFSRGVQVDCKFVKVSGGRKLRGVAATLYTDASPQVRETQIRTTGLATSFSD